MNILEQEDIIKGLPDQALQEEAKAPSGQVPQFLVVSEIQRRTDMRKKYQDPNEQQPQNTVADQITQEGIASVQPQQPMQGEQQEGQPMPMRGGGMTPFMRKYAGGGVVRMQEGGITPNEMLQLDSQMMAQKYPFLSGSRDEILQGLSGIDPNDAGYISSMFGGAPEIESVLEQVSNRNNLMSQDLSRGLSPAPMVENITEPSLLTLDGVNTLTPDGQRPYPPNTPSVDTLEQFSNAFREDAARAENLLATLDDSTAKEKEAISNPVNVNLPKIRTLGEIGEQAPQMLPLSKRKAPLSLDELVAKVETDKFSKKLPSMDEGALIAQEVGNVASGIDSSVKKGILDVGEYVTGDLADSLTDGDFSSPYEAGRTISASATQPLSFLADKLGDGYQGAYNLTAGMLEPIENLGRGLVGADERQGKGFRYDTPYFGGSDSSSSSSSEISDLDQARLEKTLALANRQQPMSQEDLQSETLKTFNNLVTNQDTSDNNLVGNQTTPTDGADHQGSGDIGVNNSNKAVNLLNNAFKLDLDASKKEAFAMAMIQLGAGIAKGDLAEGLSNAGVAASGVMESARDRSDKQLDREIQRKHYEAKLSDSRLDRQSRIRRDAGTSALKKYTAQATAPLNLAKFANMSQTEKDQLYDNIFQEELRVLTQSATGSDMRRGGSESDRAEMSYSPSTGLQSPT